MTKKWGPPTWTLFHMLAEKINEEAFSQVFPGLLSFIIQICNNLPCPDCSQHAGQFLAKVNFATIKTKNDFKNIMFIFHNAVNHRNKKPQFNIADLSKYVTGGNIIDAYNNFIAVFQTNGNMKLLADSFQRKRIISEFKKWVIANIRHFI